MQAIAQVRLAPELSHQAFERRLRTLPAVRSAVCVTGDVDYEIRLACRDLADLELVLVSLRRYPDVKVVSTALVLREVEGLGQPALAITDWRRAPRPHQSRSA
jgi:Lrp/AsnC family transcriptional regulator, leucine-responsive regulatory protein